MSVLHSILTSAPTSDEWRLYLTYRGGNDDNLSGWSEKFWEISHAAGSNEATVRWGKIGSYGQSMTCPLHKGLKTAQEKVSKGYREAPTRCKHQTLNLASKLVAKAKTKGFPYDQTVSAVMAGSSISLLDADGDVVVVLTPEGVNQLMAA